MSKDKFKGKRKVSNRVKRRQQKQQRKLEQQASRPQNLYHTPREEPVIPKVDRVAMGVRAVLVDQLRRKRAEAMAKEAQRQRRMKASQSKATE